MTLQYVEEKESEGIEADINRFITPFVSGIKKAPVNVKFHSSQASSCSFPLALKPN